MRLITTDALRATAFTLEPHEVDVSTVRRRVVVSGESARRMRASLGSPLSLRTFVLVDENAGVELTDCYVMGEDAGADSVTIVYRRGMSKRP